jgi:sigma-B regulation protein RsbU (phosphoserine phosphatase)
MEKTNKYPHSRPKRKLAFKLAAWIITATALIFSLVLVVNYYSLKSGIINQEKELVKYLARATVNNLEARLRGAEEIPESLAVVLGKYPDNRPDLLHTMQALLRDNPDIYGIGVALEPDGAQAYAPYFYRRHHDIELTFLGGDAYNYENWSWFQGPKKSGKPFWTEPYYDERGGEFIKSTYAVPIYREADGNRKKFIGVTKVDINLIWLQELISSVKILDTGYAFLLSKDGYFVTLPNKDRIMKDSVFFQADVSGDPQLQKIGRAMVAGQEGVAPLQDFLSGKKSWIYYAPLPSTGWSLGVVFPEDELLADLRALIKKLLLISLSGLIVLLGLIIYLARRITKPLTHLDQKVHALSQGNLNIQLPEPTTRDEIGTLTLSFLEMQAALKEYIADLAATTAAKERIESELKIAHAIQMSFLPKRFPPLSGREQVDIAAFLEPARQVGGDLYDYFMLPAQRLFFAIGDVSDKGVPAALFMAVTKTLMKGLAEVNLEPAEILQRVNAELTLENDANMFATVFCAILDLSTGSLIYSNAGHNPPVLLRTGQKPEWLPLPLGVFLGTFEQARYQNQEIRLDPGDRLLLYTDGITEATNSNLELFDNDRLLQTLKNFQGRTVTEMISTVMTAVKAFTKEAPPSDDITLLALQFIGK